MAPPPASPQLQESVVQDPDASFGASALDVQDETSSNGTFLGSNSPVKSSEEENTDTTEAWSRWKKEMRRLTDAIECATAVSEVTADIAVSSPDSSETAKSIAISFSKGRFYKLPWDACRTWNRMEMFLQHWFREDEDALKAIKHERFKINDTLNDVISPGLWPTLIQPNQRLVFSLQSPASAVPPPTPSLSLDPPSHLAPPGSTPVVDKTDVCETSYENEIQYKVSYYKRGEVGTGSIFVSDKVSKNPIEVEEPVKSGAAATYGKIPVLEEWKRVFSSPSSAQNKTNFARVAGRRHANFWQPDTISEPRLKINSPYLLNILKAVISCSAEPPSGDGESLDAGVFLYPFRDLYLHLEDLLDYAAGNSDLRRRHSEAFNSLADAHINLLRTYLETQPKVPFMEAKSRWTATVPVTTFGTLWLLMKPGMDVYVREADGSVNRYVLDRLRGGIVRQTSGKYTTMKYTAQVWNLVLDDTAIRQYARQIDIPIFDDERQITELPVFPVKFKDQFDNGSTRQALIARGKKYFTYSKRPCFLQYNGQGLKSGLRWYKRARVVVEHASKPWTNDGVWSSELSHYMPESRVSDTAVYERRPVSGRWDSPPPPAQPPGDVRVTIGESLRMARCECKDCQDLVATKETYLKMNFSDYRENHPNSQAELTDHQYSILPSHMFAFVLNDRNYDLVDVAKLSEPSMAETAIDRLVMPATLKELIKAVAKTYTDRSEMFSADFIHGKGEGQIILLHGPPGTGKTLTAESVAEYTRRPLLSITPADLGHGPEALEKSLLQYFRRANDWDAIVLLDEADVYLEKRSTSDLRRNSIVSVFLRALDYFQGILFLTTNRVAQFDEAFMSRIHLSLGYDKLNDDARTQIWGNLFQKLKDDHKSGGPKIQYDYDAKRYVTKDEEVKALRWNGREIRNAFQTAVALAVYDSKAKSKNGEPSVPEVTEDHLKQVVSMSSAFRRYITAAHEGMDDSVWAFKHGNRDDSITAAPQR